MWNLITSNRILDRKMKQRSHQKHLNNLTNIKSLINNTSPKRFSFLYSRPKAKQLKNERNQEIETNNTILIEKMLSTYSSIKYDGLIMKQSLNQSYNRKKQRQIQINNQGLVKRLQKACSLYQCNQILKSTNKYQKIKNNMANSRVDPWYDLQVSKKLTNNTTRPLSAKK